MMSLVSLDSQDTMPLIEQIVKGIQQQVDARVLRTGARLPSIRKFAEVHSISRFTVVQAYDRLVASGYLESRKGSGFFVTKPLSADPPIAEHSAQLERAVDVLWLLHQSFQNTAHFASPGCGWLPSEWRDDASLQKAIRTVSRHNDYTSGGYGNIYGYVPLRQDLQKRLAELGIVTNLQNILTTHGVTQGIDLVGRYLIQAGDNVLVDDPGYYSLFGHLKLLGAKLVGVPRTLDGVDTQAMETLIQLHRPKIFITNTVLHNPTGTSLSQANAHRVLQLAEKYDLLIIEDDVYGDFSPPSVSRLATLDHLNRVIYLSSFSKTITTSVRVGFLAARADIVQALGDLKLLTSLTTSETNERVIHQVLIDGYYRKHLEKLRARVQNAREKAMRQLEKAGLEIFAETEHGLFIWAKLPDCHDAAKIASIATKRGIMLAPGNVFRPHQEPSPWLRFNAAYCDNPAIFQFLAEFNDISG
ncbi:transcriptional regulator with HTH domain and aminotransferase domain [Beggiatoa alba B18LD]|uniref:Transcriptional regulator with HTH domain and aminotransferase domain n=1 Tax=Beggiatoa alba B18LD TaxID=395493 RepID=I3CEN7_9GAMM|nr:PLP-dependent aminotransferase family protein [Beggiatoa alba]EIJ42080.1 transcriptional regulator with HTH domain and aminotransferase domain [Beggiatoa alba B18LD]